MSVAASITRPGCREHLGDLLAFVERACADAGLDADTAQAVRLAAEEICVNVIAHGYRGGAAGPLRVGFRAGPEAVVVVVEDRAPRFDPAHAPAPVLEGDWESRPAGGLGLHLVRQLMDEVRYEPVEGGGNRLTLVKRRAPADT